MRCLGRVTGQLPSHRQRWLRLGKLASAVAALGCALVYLFQAIGADGLRGGFLGGGAGELVANLLRLVERLDDGKDDRRHNQKVDARANERTKVDIGARHHEPRDLGGAAAGNYGDERVDDVVGERGHDGGKRAADNHADGHVHHVAAVDKFLELVEQCLHGDSSLLWGSRCYRPDEPGQTKGEVPAFARREPAKIAAQQRGAMSSVGG